MIRLLASQEDFTQAVDLFKTWDIPSQVYETFSTTGVGYFNEEGSLEGVLFTYFTNSPIVYLDNLCVDKKLPKNTKGQVIDSLVEFVTEEVKKTGTYKFIIAEPMYEKARKRLLEYGFTQMENNDKKFWKKVA